ncbi:GAF domain-containing hybrid sensor histidine kinase/response regulator [Alteromonas sp. ASW11-130]|uniref:GAF domain-containing hybrid sensor histidine kinase/response regulator n=1 Tax=Alteromonas sp. ASW11-130 TaxID=3015775 RepID=UPI002241C306|nr:ATP-binding protein [Alteromonas sp. ASW11-130]MCW8090816.1 ATP-binding protein [Alteromonas sp. ASW11-130]
MRILRTLHTISSDINLSYDEKLIRLLNVGCNLLELEIGIVSKIDRQTYTVIAASSPDDSLEPGTIFELEDTFCIDTLDANAIVSYHDVEQVCGKHPAAEKFQLFSYIGIPLYVERKLYGTVNFSSPSARKYPFKEVELDYVILLSEWIGTELSRKLAFESVNAKNEALRRQNKMLSQISELAGVGSWEIDVPNNEIFWSKALKKLYEFPPDFDISLEAGISIIRHESERERMSSLLAECIEKGTPISTELEILTPTGKVLWIAVRAQAEYEDGVCTRILGASRDITQQVQVGKDLEDKRKIAEHALQARSQFLANMSHEIRTPINGVLGMLDTLAKTNLTERQQELCSIAHQIAESLLGLINDVLDFSKIDSGEMSFETVPLSLEALIEQQIKLFEHTAKKKGIQLQTDIEAVKGLHFQGDPIRIQQILTNLINNAIKFTHEGTVSVKTRALKQPDKKYLIQLMVEDTGVGIEKERQRKIFSPFHQGDSATTREFGGTGLGLSIVSQIAEMMGGGIRVDSKPNEGSIFTVSIQLAQSDEAYIEPEPHEIDASTCSFAGYKVLVVEDNTINQIVITEQLKELKVNIDLAENGEIAVNKVAKALKTNQIYDLILMDCQMPVMDGYTAAAKIRKMGPEGELIPIVALTANVLAGEREKCSVAGMNDYLTKPINVKRLGTCLQRFLPPQML